MECPKCGIEVDDKALVCDNCKKVLKLVCPVCKTVNTNNTCKKCGFPIILKCHKCGKICQNIDKKCKKCGFSTELSVVLNEANTDEFVMMTIEFPNMSEVRKILGAAAVFNKFKVGLDNVIKTSLKEAGLSRRIIDNVYIVRFDKDYTYKSSTQNAIKVVIDLLNKISKMNARLYRRKNAAVRTNVFLLKKTTKSDPTNYKSGFNISLINADSIKSEEDKIRNTFQVLTDDSVMSTLEKDYEFEPLNSVMINDEMRMFYEMDLQDQVTVEFEPEEEDEEYDVKIPNFVQNLLVEQDKLDGLALNQIDFPNDPDAIYDIEGLDFNEIQCDFIRTENIDVFYHVLHKVQSVPKGIISIKTDRMYKPYSLKIINVIQGLKVYNNIISITCYDEMKYAPYSFFRDLVSAIFEYTVSQKLFSKNEFTMFSSIDPDGMVKDLITLKEREIENPEDTRFTYFDIFLTLLQAIPNTLIFIEDFEKIDASSYDVMKYLFEAFEELDVSYLISHDKEFSLHRQSHGLLTKPYYTEINLKPTAFEKMIEENKYYYRKIMDNFYFQRIAKYSTGSILYIDYAIQYLIEMDIFEAGEDSIEIKNANTVVIPSNLDKLMRRRLNLLQDDAETMKFLASVVLLGTRIDLATIDALKYENADVIIEKLTRQGYIYFYNNCMYFPNYNLLRDNLLETASIIYLREIAKDLFDKVFVPEMPSPVKAYLYSLLNDAENERLEWEKLAQINLAMGDFSAYLNCINKVLKILGKNDNPDDRQAVEEYKLQLYENISTNLYEYVPDKTSDIAQTTLINLEKSTDTEKIITLCNKMIQGCLIAGDYTHALELTHKVFSLMPAASLNPADPGFNNYFFLMSLIHVQILFNIGALSACMEVGYGVLNVVKDSTIETLKPDYIAIEQFKDMLIDAVGYTAFANVLMLQGNVQEFLNIIRADFSDVPKSFDIFIALQDFLHGASPSVDLDEIAWNDKFTPIIFHIMNAYMAYPTDYAAFAEEVYRAKLKAKNCAIHQLEYFSDLLIGYAYTRMGNYKKADNIFFKLIKDTNDNGMQGLLYVSWYMMGELHILQGRYDTAYGIINNSLIQLEKNSATSEYILMLFKYSMYKVFMYKREPEKAQICMNQAQYLAGKYGIMFVFDTVEMPEAHVEEEPAPEVPAE